MVGKFLGLVAALASAAVANASGAVELTPDNFDAEFSGKNSFIKFLAPW